jgi:phenylalanyl-tRNA synthetase alpha chain
MDLISAVRLYSHDDLFGSSLKPDADLFEKDGTKTPEKQAVHTRDTSLALQIALKASLESLFRDLFGENLQMRWVDVGLTTFLITTLFQAYFPFTHPSFELEIYHEERWLEMLGCGVMNQTLLDSAGASSKVGWAFGLGLERLAMIMYGIPDIRLFWSRDSGFLSQFDGKKPSDPVT